MPICTITSVPKSIRHLSTATITTNHDIKPLFRHIEKKFPTRLREDKWYLTAVSQESMFLQQIGALVGTTMLSEVGELYRYLISTPAYANPEQRQHLVRRMREALIKCIVLNGIPRVLQALRSIAQLERQEDKDYSFSRERWQVTEATRAHALSVLDILYREDYEKIMDKFEAHRDIPFISTEISYGFFLADHTVLDLVETELVMMPNILSQDLNGPAMWHIRGCVRSGITPEETETIQQISEDVVAWAGKNADVGRVTEISDDMHGLIETPAQLEEGKK
ncbi:hypothetical protein LSUE1_G003874 [Lachnellula suecica]|uniref:Uncharacterized protein n=1 Tax=Lachnellula suecica TaxID=602035 RepID=A0A8T9CI54_9HELO|nr:hypothetical protein LSUE1_G003874 [Lachnellula suecica]